VTKFERHSESEREKIHQYPKMREVRLKRVEDNVMQRQGWRFAAV